MSSPDISVIIPVYNAEKYLRKCLDSIIRQSLRNIEVIIINDGSSDGSARIIDDCAKADNRVVAFHMENGGVSRARNEGLRRAKGRWVAFVDSDDTVAPDYFENLLNSASRVPASGVTLVISGFSIIYDGLVERREQIGWSGRVLERDAIGQAFLDEKIYQRGYPFGKLYDLGVLRQFGIEFDQQIRYCEDLIFMMDYLPHVDHLVFDTSCGYNYFCKVGAGLSKSYSSFDLEYRFVELFFDKGARLLGHQVMDADFVKTKRNFLLRAVSCLYRPVTRIDRAGRLRALKKVYDAHCMLLAGASLPHAMLYRRLFSAYDAFFFLIYVARYGPLARPWAWFCRARA